MPDFQVAIVVSVARDYDYYPEKKSPALDFDDIPIGEGDDESFGSAEYGEEATAFNEDGSFIGVYSKDKKSPNAPPAYQPATESNVWYIHACSLDDGLPIHLYKFGVGNIAANMITV